MAAVRKKIIGITGDVNPEYGSGVVYRDQYGIHWEFWQSMGEEDEKGKERYIVYRGDVPDDVFAEYNWLKAEGVASSIGMEPEELEALGRSKKIADRVEAMEAIFSGYESAENFDGYPTERTIGEINRRWGRVFSAMRQGKRPRLKENPGPCKCWMPRVTHVGGKKVNARRGRGRRHNPGTVMEQAQELRESIKARISAPYVSTNLYTLGGPERPSVGVTISFDPREQWANGILENSKFVKLMVNFSEHTIEHVVGDKVERFRKTRFKDTNEVVAKLSKWVEAQKAGGRKTNSGCTSRMTKAIEIHDAMHAGEPAKSLCKRAGHEYVGHRTAMNPPPPMSKGAPSAKLLKATFRDLSDVDARHLNKAMRVAVAGGHKVVDSTLELLNRKIGGYGVEAIEGNWHDRYYQNIVALYVNMGDTYVATVLYNTVTDTFSVTSMGDFVEANTRRYGIQ